jgi:hypothetical protein
MTGSVHVPFLRTHGRQQPEIARLRKQSCLLHELLFVLPIVLPAHRHGPAPRRQPSSEARLRLLPFPIADHGIAVSSRPALRLQLMVVCAVL